MLCIPKSKLRPTGSTRIMGVSVYAVPFLLRSGRLRGRSCNRKVGHPFGPVILRCLRRQMPRISKFLRVALSIDHCMAFEMAFPTVLVGSLRRNFQFRAWSVLVTAPISKWWCLGAALRPGRAAAVLGAPSCVLRVRLSIDKCIVFETAFRTVPVHSHLRNSEVSEIVDCVLGF